MPGILRKTMRIGNHIGIRSNTASAYAAPSDFRQDSSEATRATASSKCTNIVWGSPVKECSLPGNARPTGASKEFIAI